MSGLSGFGGGSGGGSDAGEATSQSSSQSSQQQQQQQQQSQVKLDMTVKLDIEARQPSDLLLRLQPFLSSSSSQEEQQQQQQGSDEGALELNLGLSLGGTSAGESPVKKAKKGAEFLQQEQQQKGEFLRGWCSKQNAAAGVAEEQNQIQNSPQQQQQQQQQQVLLRPTSNQTQQQQQQQQVAGREHAAKLRKKRRLLIDECRRSGLPRPGLGAYRRCRPPVSPPTSRLAPVDELKPSPAEVPSDSAEDTELRNVRGRLAVGSAVAGRVKVETGEGAAESSKVIRPSPIHESKEWVQKFLEMRSSEPSTSLEGEEESRSRRLSGPSTSSSLENPAFPGFDVKSPDNSPKHRLMSPSSQGTSSFSPCLSSEDRYTDCSRPSLASSSLFRSTSLGSSFASFKSDPPTQQEPSPVATRTDNSAGVLLRTFSEGSKLEREISFGSPAATQHQQQQQQQMQQQQRPNLPKLSAFKSPKKEPVDEDPGTSRPRTGMKRSNSAVFGIGGQAAAAAAAAAARASLDSTRMFRQLPLVSTTGTGPNGKTVSGVLFAYRKGDVKIICACHGRHMTAREFVEHAGGVNVTHPEKCIVVNPSMLTRSRSMINNMPSTTAPPSS